MAYKVDEISSLSTADFIRLVATYNHLTTDKKTDVDPKLVSRGYSTAALKAATEKAEAGFEPVTSMGLRFTRPLKYFKSDLISYSLLLLENYERGVLPFPGSVSEQPAQIMEIFGVLQSLRNEREHKLNEIQRKKSDKDVRHQRQGRDRASR